jgi:hypothetical protein
VCSGCTDGIHEWNDEKKMNQNERGGDIRGSMIGTTRAETRINMGKTNHKMGEHTTEPATMGVDEITVSSDEITNRKGGDLDMESIKSGESNNGNETAHTIRTGGVRASPTTVGTMRDNIGNETAHTIRTGGVRASPTTVGTMRDDIGNETVHTIRTGGVRASPTTMEDSTGEISMTGSTERVLGRAPSLLRKSSARVDLMSASGSPSLPGKTGGWTPGANPP